MITYQWKVKDIISENNKITQIAYSVTAKNETKIVETEGNWTLKDKSHFLQEQTTEKDVIAWIQKESIIDEKCIIEDNLEKQLLANEPEVLKKPWVLPTFTVTI
jgi:hypothetical protein